MSNPLRKRTLIGLLVAAILLGGGIYAYMRVTDQSRANQLTLYGHVELREAELASSVSEHLAEIRVEEGDSVEAGEVLAVLEQIRYRQAVAKAAGRVAAQQARVDKLVRGTRPQEIRKARADVKATRVETANAQRRFQRFQDLVKKEFVSQQALDDARAALRGVRARLEARKEAFKLALEGPRKEDIVAAKAQLRSDRAALRTAREDLEDTWLKAPASGIIRNRLLEAGEWASPQTPIVTLALRDELWIRAFVPEPQLGQIRPGMPAEIQTDTFPDKRYVGRVGHIAPSAEFTPKAVQTTDVRPQLVYRVRINACDPQGELRLGMPVTVTLPLNSQRGKGPERSHLSAEAASACP